jgi:hypothetical protein
MDALDAAEAAGGDRRGKQSAALLVEQAGAAATSRYGLDATTSAQSEASRAGLVRAPASGPMLYNLACYEALAGHKEDAVAHLAEALRLDPGMLELARGDSDLDSLRQDDALRALVSD